VHSGLQEVGGADFSGADAITYTGDASFQWTDSVMTYFRASRGWQSGFANMDATDPRLMNVVDPEKLLTYEVGARHSSSTTACA